jgi:hypothetical protein
MTKDAPGLTIAEIKSTNASAQRHIPVAINEASGKIRAARPQAKGVIKRAATKPLRFSPNPVFAFKISWESRIATGLAPLLQGQYTLNRNFGDQYRSPYVNSPRSLNCAAQPLSACCSGADFSAFTSTAAPMPPAYLRDRCRGAVTVRDFAQRAVHTGHLRAKSNTSCTLGELNTIPAMRP